MTPRFDLLGIITSDLAASLAFYRRLGLDIPQGAETLPHVECTGPGGVRIAWDTEETIRSFAPDWTPPPHRAGRIGLAFLCDSPAEVDKLYGELTDTGYEGPHAPWDADWGQRYAVVLDPDGNEISLFAPQG
ncbi:VOC family protein [Streptomyces oryzae]|uniref:VOC family protein n=1 Tax=Streptomyces oryzae TaxID=1434886 RepID=A0ABS3X6G4_9ACTN|nr:VOC family protein [Streptomyces oryzae]MBO8190946.1 VOC family protein [Streptomyces oryzae]